MTYAALELGSLKSRLYVKEKGIIINTFSQHNAEWLIKYGLPKESSELKPFLKDIIENIPTKTLQKTHIVIPVPHHSNTEEREAIKKLLSHSNKYEIKCIENSIAALIGSDIPLDSGDHIICHISSDYSEICSWIHQSIKEAITIKKKPVPNEISSAINSLCEKMKSTSQTLPKILLCGDGLHDPSLIHTIKSLCEYECTIAPDHTCTIIKGAGRSAHHIKEINQSLFLR